MTLFAPYAWAAGLVGLLAAFLIYFYLKKQSPGSQAMQDIAGLIEEGAMAFLRREAPFGGSPRPDLILLDLNMPRKDGWEVLQEIKSDPDLSLLPVIILTTTDDEREIQRCYDLGANVYITKPVDYDGFANAIRQLGLFFSVMQIP